MATLTGTTWVSLWNSDVVEEPGSGSVAPALLRWMSSTVPVSGVSGKASTSIGLLARAAWRRW
jgi:hypothetical protein